VKRKQRQPGSLSENLHAKLFHVFEKRARAAIPAADPGWVAIACGPLLGLIIFLTALPATLAFSLGGPHRDPYAAVKILFLLTGGGFVAGAMLASAFWVSSAHLDKDRKEAQREGGVRDPDLDGPL